jgi:hypothetical protein
MISQELSTSIDAMDHLKALLWTRKPAQLVTLVGNNSFPHTGFLVVEYQQISLCMYGLFGMPRLIPSTNMNDSRYFYTDVVPRLGCDSLS